MRKYILAASMAALVAFHGLSQGKSLVVTTSDDARHAFDTEKIEKILFSDNLVSYPVLISAEYNTSSSLGVYTVTIGNEAGNGVGLPSSVGDSQLVFSFAADMAADPQNASLPSGEYKMGNGTETGTFNIQKSAFYLRISDGDDGIETMPIIGGKVDVLNVDGKYVITGSVTTLQGYSVEFIYDGPIKFIPSISQSSPFDDDLNVVFDGAQMRYYGNWFYPFSDDLTFQLYTGGFDANDNHTEGYWFNVDLYMPKVVDPTSNRITIADGVYNVEWRERPENSTYLPYTYMPGRIQEVFGIEMTTGTYISHKASDGLTNLGLISSGTITVSNNGTDFVFDLIMSNGKKLTGTYKGNVLLGNFYSGGEPEGIEMLDSDVELEWAPNTVAISYNDGPTILKDINTYMVMITDQGMAEGDYLSLFLLTDKEELVDGTYNMGKLENYGGVKGCVSYGGTIEYSWYSDLSSTDDDGYQTVMAPLAGGTVTVTTIERYKKKFEINLTTKEGRTIKGVYEGLCVDYNDLEEGAAAKVKALRSKKIEK